MRIAAFIILLSLILSLHAENTFTINKFAGLENSAYNFEGAITSEWVKNTQGGIATRDTWLTNIDLTLGIDTEKAGWWADGEVFVYILGNYNSSRLPTEFIGDIQASSNIEAPETWKIYELWYQHSFAEGKIQWLTGLHDLNSEFYVLEYAGLFRGSSFGIGAEVAQVGNGPSIFPTTSLASRLKVNLGKAYVQFAVYDGFPGDRDNDNGTQISYQSKDGLLYIAEAGFSDYDEDFYKIALGLWYHSLETEDNSGNSINDNWGTYVIAEKSLNDWLGAFIQLGYASKGRNQLSYYTGAGFNVHNLSFMGEGDQLGLAVARAWLGDDFRSNNPGFETAETAVELTYSKVITDNLRIQPGLQFIHNPSSSAGIDDALQVSIVIELTF